MKYINTIIFLSLILLFFHCTKKPDNTKQKAILSYVLTCTGGSLAACNESCVYSCGLTLDSALTPSNYPCLTSCQSTCSTNCNSLNLLLVLSRK